MRLLIACPECKRQYDAVGKEIGTRFHCRCGEVVAVRQPHGHDASVVRCSSCGAPRESESAACTFCTADFTLHERDLHTVCPKCLARISDRAKYCHHCGVHILPEVSLDEVTRLICPHCACDTHLMNRRIGGQKISISECGRCAGIWLSHHTFFELTEKASNELSKQEFARLTGELAASISTPGEYENWRYRSCPVCTKMMQRRNYGHKSGVIMDACRDHGIWLDCDELPHILSWIRSGGLGRAKQKIADAQRVEENTRRISKLPSGYGNSGSLRREPIRDGWDMVFLAISSLFD